MTSPRPAAPTYWLTVLALLLITAAVNLQSPLYQRYVADSGATHAMLTVAFACYVLGLVPVLLGFSGASARFGRAPVLALALMFSMGASLLMALVPTLDALFFARVMQGIGVGLGMGTVAAYLGEQRPGHVHKVASHVALASSLGFGGGALATSISVGFVHTPVPVSFIAEVSLLVVVAVFFALFGDRQKIVGTRMICLPRFRRENTAAYLSIAAAWSVSGMVVAVLPASLSEHGLALWAGPALFLVNIVGVVFQPIARRIDPGLGIGIGCLLVPLGYGVLVAGSIHGSVALVLAGASIAGAACYGFTYLGGLTHVVERSGNERAASTSGYFLFAYAGFSVPTIGLGVAADRFGLARTLVMFGLAIVLVHLGIGWSRFRSRSDAVSLQRLKGQP